MLKLVERAVFILLVAGIIIAGLAFMKTRGIKDNEGPVIGMDEDTVTVSVNDENINEEILAGIAANDNRDGDVTDSLIIQGLSNFIETGRRKATIVAFDDSNNVSKVTRDVVYSDYVSPKFSLDEPLRYQINSTYTIDSPFKVTDMLDGDMSSQVTITVGEDFTTYDAGNYMVNFSVTNSAGDEVILPVTVTYYDPSEDSACPKPVLSDYLIYLEKGSSFSASRYLQGLLINNKEYDSDEIDEMYSEDRITYSMDDVHIDKNGLDTETEGVYEVIYSVSTEDAYTASVRLIVIVE